MDWDYHSINIGAQQGWQCPVCGKVNAPWMMQCTCDGKASYKIDYTRETTTTGSQIIYTYKPLNTSEDSRTDVKTAKVDYTEEMTTTDIPTACRTCLNHPSNGGDGNCFCSLGTLGITF